MGQQRHLVSQQLAGLHVPVAGQGADGHVVTGVVDGAGVDHAVDPDHHRRRGQTEPHQWNQAVAARHQLRLVAVLGQGHERRLDRVDGDVVERGGDHWASWMAFHTRRGVAGISRSVMP